MTDPARGPTTEELRARAAGMEQFLLDVHAVVVDHWSGLPEDRPPEDVWRRLDAVLFDHDGNARPQPLWDRATAPLDSEGAERP